jgi:hypothetical protein
MASTLKDGDDDDDDDNEIFYSLLTKPITKFQYDKLKPSASKRAAPD